MRRSRWVLALLAALGVAACADQPTPAGPVGPAPVAGTLTVRLTSPNADDGAILFDVTGPGIDTVLAGDASLQLFSRRSGDSTVAGAIVGDVTGGVVIQLRVPDVSAAGRYTARVLEVADRQDEVRASLTGYALTIAP